MQRLRSVVIVMLAGSAACGGSSPDASSRPSSGDDASGAGEASSPAIDGGGGGGGGETGGDDAGVVPPDTGVAQDAAAPCYSEPYAPGVPVDDLKSAYTGAAWLSSSLTAMQRRYPTGYFVLNAEQGDTQLPGFADPSSWSALMESLMTMVHEESHGWDFDHAQGTTHPYVLLDSMQITVPPITTWARSEITQYITDATTQQYDQTYLVGTQGTYDAVFLFEELNAYCNGLAAITAVGDQITQTISARDGVAAHLYYLELYLRVGRTAHPADYAAMAADPSWMKLVRYEWARGHFWDAQAKANASLDIASAPIWAHIVEPANLDEIQKFTGQSPDAVACHP
jgi:hypothetical protein